MVALDSTSFSFAVTANVQLKISALDNFNSFASLKTSIEAMPEGFSFSLSLHSQRSMHNSEASRGDNGCSTLLALVTTEKNSYNTCEGTGTLGFHLALPF